MSSRSLAAALLTTSILVTAGSLPLDAAEMAVAPGTVLRWPGEDLEGCGWGGRTWEPLAGDCWFAVDLLTPEGALFPTRWREGRREQVEIRVTAYPYPTQRITLPDDSKVDLSPADLRRVEGENRLIGALWDLDTPRRFEFPLAPPLEPLPDGSRFGARRFFNDQPRSPHSGADFSAAAGTPVMATAAGTVALAGEFFFSGRSVFLDHGDGLISMYFHLDRIEVKQGETVHRGQRIGRVGQTGRATGPHLHFGVRWRRARVDPGLLLASSEHIPTLR